MPVVPSFRGYAPTPNLATAYLGGVRLSQEAQQHAQSLQLQREKLAQDAAQAEMEFNARMAVHERDQLRQEHQLEIEKAYKQAQIGLSEQRLADTARAVQMRDDQATQANMIRAQGYGIRAGEAADRMAAMQAYQQLLKENLAKGMDPEEAARDAARVAGPQIGAGFSTAIRPPSGAGYTTETQVFPRQEETSAAPEEKDYPGPLGVGRLFGMKPETIPAVPAMPERPERRITQRVPIARTNAPVISRPPAAPVRKPTQKAIDYLKAHPDKRDEFDDWYGEGASDQYLD